MINFYFVSMLELGEPNTPKIMQKFIIIVKGTIPFPIIFSSGKYLAR